jgi:hypothetical protein
MTFIIENALFYALFLVPLLAGILGIFINSKFRNHLSLAAALLLFFGSIGLGFLGEKKILTPFVFLGAPIHFSISPTAVYLYGGLLLALLSLYWLDSRMDRNLNLYSFILINLSLSAGFLALMSGQFMLRYIALELVGLLIALSILGPFQEMQNLKKFMVVFQILRLGDLFLLVSILLTNSFAETYDISAMIAAAAEMPPASRTWVLSGFILAILIKLGIWPFGIWLRHARQRTRGASFWVSGFLMPVLGCYLLYRILPILHVDLFIQTAAQFVSLGLLALILLVNWRGWAPRDRFLLVNGLSGCFVLGAAAMPGTDFIGYYLAALILVRLFAFFGKESDGLRGLFWAWVPLAAVNAVFLWANFSQWTLPLMLVWGALSILPFWIHKWLLQPDEGQNPNQDLPAGYPIPEEASNSLLTRSAAWLNRKLEKNLLVNGYSALSGSLLGLASWMRENIEAGFEGAWLAITRGLVRTSEATLAAMEVRPAEKTDDFVGGVLQKLAAYESNVLKKTLRWDLALIPLFFLVIIVLLLII